MLCRNQSSKFSETPFPSFGTESPGSSSVATLDQPDLSQTTVPLPEQSSTVIISERVLHAVRELLSEGAALSRAIQNAARTTGLKRTEVNSLVHSYNLSNPSTPLHRGCMHLEPWSGGPSHQSHNPNEHHKLLHEYEISARLSKVFAVTHKFEVADLETMSEEQILAPTFPDKKGSFSPARTNYGVSNPYLDDLRALRSPPLPPSLQIELFRQYNYLKFCVIQLRARLNPESPILKSLEKIEGLLGTAERVRNQLYERNLRMVISIVKRLAHPSSEAFDLLVSDGNIQLWGAIEKFEYARGFAFSTFASRVLEQNLRTAQFKGIRRRQVSLNALHESVMPELDERFCDNITRELHFSCIQREVKKILRTLPPLQRRIIVRRFGLGDENPETLKEIGEHLDLTKERVRQIESAAIVRLAARAVHSDPETLSMYDPNQGNAPIKESIISAHPELIKLQDLARTLDMTPNGCVLVKTLWLNPIKGLLELEQAYTNNRGDRRYFDAALTSLSDEELLKRSWAANPLFQLSPTCYWAVHDIIELELYTPNGSIDLHLKKLKPPEELKRRVS